MKVDDEFRDAFKNILIGTVFSAKEIERMIKEKYGRTSGSIMPYSYCYNRWCTGISEMDRLCIFEYIYDSDNDKTYKYLGEGYNYNGKVYHFPKSGSTKCIGEWLNGKYHKY